MVSSIPTEHTNLKTYAFFAHSNMVSSIWVWVRASIIIIIIIILHPCFSYQS